MQKWPREFDYIVVGAGTAGAVLATRLSDDPSASILLLEAGDDFPRPSDLPKELEYLASELRLYESDFDWGYQALFTETSEKLAHLPRARVVGGGSAVNGALFLRGLSEDFAEWVEAGNDRWSYNEVIEDFRRTETDFDCFNEFHGIGGPIPVRRARYEELTQFHNSIFEAALRMGLETDVDMNGPSSRGVGFVPVNSLGGRRISTATAYLAPVRHRQNLVISSQTTATKIRFDNQRAIGISGVRNGSSFDVDGNHIVVCAGAIGSPHLLMLSGIGPANELLEADIPVVHHLPGVGARLEDHPSVRLEYTRSSSDPADSEGPLVQIGMRLTAANSDLTNDLLALPLESVQAGRGGGLKRTSEKRLHGVLVLLARPYASGVLKIVSNDPRLPPRIRFNYLSDSRDRSRLRDGVQRIDMLFHEASSTARPMKRLVPACSSIDSVAELDAWIESVVRTGHHSACTCKMGPATDPLAVTDQHFRVHGLRNLSIVDASVMPRIVGANTNATTMMLAERAARVLRGDFSRFTEQTDAQR